MTPEGRISAQDTGLWNDEQRDAWARIVDFVHTQHAAIGVQLAHAGRKASTYRGFPGEPSGSVPADAGGWTTIGPSAEAFVGYAAAGRAAARQEISEVVDRLRRCPPGARTRPASTWWRSTPPTAT